MAGPLDMFSLSSRMLPGQQPARECRSRRHGWQLVVLLVAGLGSLGCIGSARAGTDAGIDDLAQGDYFAAMSQLLPEAKAGDPRAQANLALIYHYGLGIAANFEKAYQWYHAAALQGSVDGQLGLAVMYSKGQGVPLDLAIAHMWLSVVCEELPPGEDRDRAALDRDTMGDQLTSDQRERSDQLIEAWRRDHTAP